MIEAANQPAPDPQAIHTPPEAVIPYDASEPVPGHILEAEARTPVDPWAPAPIGSPYARIEAAAALLRPTAEKWHAESQAAAAQAASRPVVPVIPGRPDAVDPVRPAARPSSPRHAAPETPDDIALVPTPRRAPRHQERDWATEVPDDEQGVVAALSRTLVRYQRQHATGTPEMELASKVLQDLLMPAPNPASRRYEAYQRFHSARLQQAMGLLAALSANQ